MSTALQAVIFDLDGTLVDTRGDIHQSVLYLRQSYGLEPIDLAETVARVGHGVEHLISQVLDDKVKHDITESVQRFVDHYQAHCCDQTEPYPGVPELIHALKQQGVKVAVLTNKREASARQILDGLDLELDAVLGAVEGRPHKPDPEALRAAVRALDVDRRAVVYVGDLDIDLDCARAADVAFIGVDFGFMPDVALCEHTAVCVDNVHDLRRALLERD